MSFNPEINFVLSKEKHLREIIIIFQQPKLESEGKAKKGRLRFSKKT